MKFVCDRCQTRYSIADEKVRQKILRIRCKTCGNVILVQDSAAVPEGEPGVLPPHPGAAGSELKLPPPSRSSSGSKLAAPSAAKVTSSHPKPAPSLSARPASEPRLPPAPGASSSALKIPSIPTSQSSSSLRASPADGPKGRFVVPPPPPPATVAPDPLGGRVEWYVAVAGAQSGPFSRVEAAKRIVAVDQAKAVHVWKEGMSGWKPPTEVSVIAREINLLRPTPPPPPAAPTPRPVVASAKHGTTPSPLASSSAETLHKVQPHPASADASPGKPVVPIRASMIAEASDFQADADTESDVFAEVTTQKKKRVIESPSFTDVTTKKGKSLRDLETDPSSAPSAQPADEPTPPPSLYPSVSVARRTSSSLVRASIGEPPTLPNPPSLTPAPQPIPTVTFDPTSAPATSPSAVANGFEEVVATMSTVAPASNLPDSSPAAIVPVTTGAYAPSTEVAVVGRSRAAELLQGRSGLKYLLAAVVLVALVILLVVFNLRGDGSKKSAVTREPPRDELVMPEPSKAPEEPSVAQPADDRPAGPSRAGAKHAGAVVKTRSVGPSGPVERPVASPKPTSKPGKGDSARPNPFDDTVQPVSQEKISAVVRDKNNQMALRSCYERALKMDNHLTSGRMDVTVSIAATGVVKSVVVNAPSSFIMVEPCIKLAVRRWRFPPNFEEYGTNFPLIMQGGM